MQWGGEEVPSSKMNTNNDYRTIWLSTRSMDKNTAQVEDTILKNHQTTIQDLSTESELSIKNARA
jgi:hypothetical protein